MSICVSGGASEISERAETIGNAEERRSEPAAATAYRAVERLIVTLSLPPGASVSEAEIMQRVELGRTPVREALQRLAWEGFVTIRPRAGISVAALNPSDWIKVIDARRGIETVLARSAARYLTAETAKQFHNVSLQMSRAALTGDVMAFLDADRAFDEALSAAADNEFAARLAAPLQTHSRRFWFRYQSDDGLTAATEAHLGIVGAIVNGDEEGAARKAGDLMDLLRSNAVAVATR
ncbi:MAG: GntR family transcriptional regulator [Rhizobiaceae bacterium]